MFIMVSKLQGKIDIMSESISSETENFPPFSDDELQNFGQITQIAVRGYKSLYEESTIEVRPLTILAGANSSGKSSMMQPLLLLKQTLDATYDPGALLIYASHLKFTRAAQLLSQLPVETRTDRFSIQVETNIYGFFKNTFKNSEKNGFELIESIYDFDNFHLVLTPNQTDRDLPIEVPPIVKYLYSFLEKEPEKIKWDVIRNRCFFEIDVELGGRFSYSDTFQKLIRQIVHVPALRGNPERTYNTTAVMGSEFPGMFENYIASLINHWQNTEDKRLIKLGKALETLGLTWKVDAKQVNDVQIELRVARLPRRSEIEDMVNLADVGFGVSQTLPVLVALFVAKPGQLVYLEQPEVHLHPRAQVALAEVLADAANRGVKVVVETHSELLLLAIQSLVAEGKLLPDLVKLHWFRRREEGVTEVSSADLDEAGAFGDWPEDFGDVSLKLENRYLDAAEAHLWKR